MDPRVIELAKAIELIANAENYASPGCMDQLADIRRTLQYELEDLDPDVDVPTLIKVSVEVL